MAHFRSFKYLVGAGQKWLDNVSHKFPPPPPPFQKILYETLFMSASINDVCMGNIISYGMAGSPFQRRYSSQLLGVSTATFAFPMIAPRAVARHAHKTESSLFYSENTHIIMFLTTCSAINSGLEVLGLV